MSNWYDRVTRVVMAGSFAILAGSVGVSVAHGDDSPQVTICHLPPGDPTNVQLITVGAPAVPAHVANHGDAVCADGDSDCCADPSGEVCTNLQDDVNNCGTCGNACSEGQVCTLGECVTPCVDILLDCDPSSPVLEHVCGVGLHTLQPFTAQNISYVVFGADVTSVDLIHCTDATALSGQTLSISSDTNLCFLTGGCCSTTRWNDRVCSIEIF